MAFDGTAVAALNFELNKKLAGGRINKIAQPEKDELLITIKNNGSQFKLLVSASASLPLMYLTETGKTSPLTAPNFCMLLRKHINGGKITSFTQPGLERIININIEHLNEMGDLCNKILIVELMGKHSNIIFCDGNKIIDSIKHISGSVSSVRSVLPGFEYFIPNTYDKIDPLNLNYIEFSVSLKNGSQTVLKSLYNNFTGISPSLAEEIAYTSEIDSERPAHSLTEREMENIFNSFSHIMENVKNGSFQPTIYFENNIPKDFCSLPLKIYSGLDYDSTPYISEVLEMFYSRKSAFTRIRQKSSDLRQIVNTILQKDYKKYDLQLKQIKDTEKKEKYKIYGELITAYGYSLEDGSATLECNNYYNGEDIVIPLDPELSPIENAKNYFNRYAKLKRTFEALSEIVEETETEIKHLESISSALDLAESEADLNEIKDELMEFGYVRRKKTEKKPKLSNKPLHFISSDGFHIYVGKNNYQNEEITFKLASGNDWWFHAKGIPGSHVLVKTQGKELPDNTFEEAAKLAAFYSKGRNQEKVEVDYLEKRNIKKPGNYKPGFVIYHTNFSMAIKPEINNIEIYRES